MHFILNKQSLMRMPIRLREYKKRVAGRKEKRLPTITLRAFFDYAVAKFKRGTGLSLIGR